MFDSFRTLFTSVKVYDQLKVTFNTLLDLILKSKVVIQFETLGTQILIIKVLSEN